MTPMRDTVASVLPLAGYRAARLLEGYLHGMAGEHRVEYFSAG